MLRTAMLMEGRRYAHELQAQRELAERAETSRFTQLREQVNLEFARLHTALQDIRASLMGRTEGMEQSLLKTVDEATNSLAANVGEVDEKLDRALARITV